MVRVGVGVRARVMPVEFADSACVGPIQIPTRTLPPIRLGLRDQDTGIRVQGSVLRIEG